MFSKRILAEINKYTKYDLSAFIDTAKFNVNQQLNREWIKGIRGYGNIEDIKLIGIYPLSQFLVIRSNCTGLLFVKVESVDFSL